MFGLGRQPVVTDEKRIDEALSRGVEAVFPSRDSLKSRMSKGERLTFYLGIDPTSTTLHLGHAIPLRKLGELQRLGHQIILLIGDFTAMIGDPTDKSAARKKLTHGEVLENCKKYKEQASKFISFSGSNKALLKYNSAWLSNMPMEEVFELMSHVTYAQTIKRDMFQARIEQGKDLFLHEFMYPLMQGYDSVAMDVDGEIGGNDQTFNMLVGRDLLKRMKNKEKFVIATKLLTDSSGKKMGKTEGNMVSLDQTPEDMFGKIMSWSDNLIIPGLEIATDIPLDVLESIKNSLTSGANPRDFKIRLAMEIVFMIHGNDAAAEAREAFEKTFSQGAVPENIQEVEAEKGTLVRDLLVKEGIVSSNADWKRLVDSNAVSHAGTDTLITDVFAKIDGEMTLRVGKKRFVKIVER